MTCTACFFKGTDVRIPVAGKAVFKLNAPILWNFAISSRDSMAFIAIDFFMYDVEMESRHPVIKSHRLFPLL